MKINLLSVFIMSFIMVMLLTLQPLQAQMGGLSIGTKAGSTGIGLEAASSISNKLNGRISGSFFSYSTDGILDDDDLSIRYDMKSSITSIAALLDFYPNTRRFRLTAGLYYHDFNINGEAVPSESYTMDDKTFTPEKLGSLSAKVDYSSKFVPYAGLGFGNSLGEASRIKFSLDLGVMYTGSPQVRMDGEGMIAPTARQDKNFENGLRDFSLYPVLNLGLSYRIF